MNKLTPYIKANRRGSREACLDNGFKSVHKIHRGAKLFSRKTKHIKKEVDMA